MKFGQSQRQRRAFTWVELLMVIGIGLVLVGMFLPSLACAGCKATRIKCVNNLKNVGLAFRIFATEHGDKFPMEVPFSEHGTLGFPATGPVFKQFLTLTNELAMPKILTCPSDKMRPPVESWTEFDNSHLSYFLGVNASSTHPQMLLAGDRNITNGVAPRRGVLDLFTNTPAGWTQDIHIHQGNAVLVDGSVQQLNSSRLREQLQNSGDSTNRILLPE